MCSDCPFLPSILHEINVNDSVPLPLIICSLNQQKSILTFFDCEGLFFSLLLYGDGINITDQQDRVNITDQQDWIVQFRYIVG